MTKLKDKDQSVLSTPTETESIVCSTPTQPMVVDDSDEYILTHIGAYLEYIRSAIRQIITDENLQYSEPMDKKRTYPAFTYIQFTYLLGRVYDEVFSVNPNLLYIIPKKTPMYAFDMDKVKLCYKVYCKLCAFYGFICSAEGFYTFSGIGESTLRDWLNRGLCDVYKDIQQNQRDSVVSSMENSSMPILRLASANYKYKMSSEPLSERETDMITDHLPDLLALPKSEKPSEN